MESNNKNDNFFNSISKNSLSFDEKNEDIKKDLLIIEYKKFLAEMNKNLSKSKYRKTLDELEYKEGLFSDIEKSWKIKELKIKSILKIVHRKIYISDNPRNVTLKSIEKWLFRLDDIFLKWIEEIKITDDNHEEIESIVSLFLEQLLLIAIYKKQDNLIDCCTILAIAESTIKTFFNFSLNPDFYNICQKIYLFISSLLISDQSLETAKLYQSLSIKAALHELFFRVDIENGTNMHNLSKKELHKFHKLFINITITYYQRGVTEENKGNINLALESYKQAEWFSKTFIKYQYPEISQFITDIYKRESDYHYIIKNIILEKNKEYSKTKLVKEKKVSNIKHDIFLKNKQILMDKKKARVTEMINSFDFQEFEFAEDENKSYNTKNILSTITLLDNFTSSKFKDLLKNDIDVAKIHKLDKLAVEKIQKKLNDIKTDKLHQKRDVAMKNEQFKNLIRNSQALREDIMNKKINNDSKNSFKNNENENLDIEYKNENKINNNDNSFILNICPNEQQNIENNNKSIYMDIYEKSFTANYNRKMNSQDIKDSNKRDDNQSNSTYPATGKMRGDSYKSNDINKNMMNLNENNNYNKINNYSKINENNKINMSSRSLKSDINLKSIKQYSDKSSVIFKNLNEVEYILNEKNNNSLMNFMDNNIEKIEDDNPKKKVINHFKRNSMSNLTCNSEQKKYNIVKYDYDKYINSSTYQKKFEFLEDTAKKERDFQKKLLKLKRFENLPVDPQTINNNPIVIKNEAESNFNRIVSLSKITNLLQSEKKKSDNIKDSKKFRNERIKVRLEVSLLKSLDPKALKNWDSFNKSSEKKEQKTLREEFLVQKRESQIISKNNLELIKKINQREINKIDKNLQFIEKKEGIFRKMIKQKSTLNDISVGDTKHKGKSFRMSNINFSKNSRNIESFVKFEKRGSITSEYINENLKI